MEKKGSLLSLKILPQRTLRKHEEHDVFLCENSVFFVFLVVNWNCFFHGVNGKLEVNVPSHLY